MHVLSRLQTGFQKYRLFLNGTLPLLVLVLPVCAGAAPASDAVDPEQEYTEKLPGTMADHATLIATGRSFTLYDGDKGTILGTLPGEFESNLAVAPDRKTYYVATTMWTRGDHGEREDLLQAYDASTLNLTKEISLPPRALSVFKNQDLGVSNDGHWAYVFDMTPTTRVTVVDLRAGKVATNIDISGCALEFEWAKGGFSSLCGDGGLANVAYDGGTAKVTHTPRFFDADEAPIFEQSPVDPASGLAFFVSYDGKVYRTKLGPDAKPDAPWDLNEAAGLGAVGRGVQELGWRPGGSEPFAYHAGSHRLFVLMHVGHYWTHKDPGNEVWVYDTTARKRVARYRMPVPVAALSVSQDAAPQLYAITYGKHAPGKLLVLDAKNGKVEHDIQASAMPLTVVAGM